MPPARQSRRTIDNLETEPFRGPFFVEPTEQTSTMSGSREVQTSERTKELESVTERSKALRVIGFVVGFVRPDSPHFTSSVAMDIGTSRTRALPTFPTVQPKDSSATVTDRFHSQLQRNPQTVRSTKVAPSNMQHVCASWRQSEKLSKHDLLGP